MLVAYFFFFYVQECKVPKFMVRRHIFTQVFFFLMERYELYFSKKSTVDTILSTQVAIVLFVYFLTRNLT